MKSEIAVNFDSVSFFYGDINSSNRVQVLSNASFHLHDGEFAAMVGPNGSGKTTVLKLLFGLEKPSEGTIKIFGETARNSNGKNLAYVSQQIPSDNLFPITVRDIVRMGMLSPLGRYSMKKNFYHEPHKPNELIPSVCTRTKKMDFSYIDEALEKTGIADLAARSYNSLSGGQKRRALVARALAANPRLLVLDEPTANMDKESELRLYETLGAYKGKMTIIVVTHDTEYVTSLTDRVLCLGDSQKIVQHGLEESVSNRHGEIGQQMRVLHGKNLEGDSCCN